MRQDRAATAAMRLRDAYTELSFDRRAGQVIMIVAGSGGHYEQALSDRQVVQMLHGAADALRSDSDVTSQLAEDIDHEPEPDDSKQGSIRR